MAADDRDGERLSALSPAKRALLEARLRASLPRAQAEAPIAPRGGEGPVPATPAQERMWLFEQSVPAAGLFNVPFALRLAGPLDPEALAESLAMLVSRQGALRTTFQRAGAELLQVVAPALEVPLRSADLRDLPRADREAAARALLDVERRASFDLSLGPLARFTLLRMDEEEHALFVTTHHVISDGFSVGVFLADLGALYTACVTGRPALLPPLPVQFIDYAAWLHLWLRGPQAEASFRFWAGQLADLPDQRVPADRERAGPTSFRMTRRARPLSQKVVAAVRAAGREGITPFTALAAAVLALLHGATGAEDLRVGALAANRDRPELAGLIGLFVNTLLLRVSLHGNPTARELLVRVRDAALEARAHEGYPFEALLPRLRESHGKGAGPLFEVLLIAEHAAPMSLGVSGVEVRYLEGDEEDGGTRVALTSFDWILALKERGEGLVVSWSYRTNLFDDQAMARRFDALVALLERMAAEPDVRLAALRAACCP